MSWSRQLHDTVMRKSRNKIFVRGFSHENLMRLSWAFNAREKNEILTSKNAHEKISWECHFLMRISWESHEILMSFQFSWEKWDSQEQKTSWQILMRIGKFSWECHFLMRISWDSHKNSKTHKNFFKGNIKASTLCVWKQSTEEYLQSARLHLEASFRLKRRSSL